MKNIFFSFFCLLIVLNSCKKNDPSTPCKDDFGDCDGFLDFEEMLVDTFLFEDGSALAYTYDSEGRLTQIAGLGLLLTYDYSTPGKVLRIGINTQPGQPNDTFNQQVYLLENGLAAQRITTSSNGMTIDVYDRNPDGTVNKFSNFDSNNQLVFYQEYEYDAEGNETIMREKDKNGVLVYQRNSAYGSLAPQNTIITGKVFIWIDQPKRATQKVVTSYSNPNSPQVTTSNFEYELDAHGRIIKETSDNGSHIFVNRYGYKI